MLTKQSGPKIQIWQQKISTMSCKKIFFCQKMVELCPFITSCFWGPVHCKDHKLDSDPFLTWQVLSKFWVGKKICDDPTASIVHWPFHLSVMSNFVFIIQSHFFTTQMENNLLKILCTTNNDNKTPFSKCNQVYETLLIKNLSVSEHFI